MKALSVPQPYAQLIVKSYKTVEVRSWSTPYRGELLIVASANPKNFFYREPHTGPRPLQLYAGCIIGVCELMDCVRMRADHEHDAYSNHDETAWAWELDHMQFCKPVPVVGRLGLYDVPDKLIEYLDDEQAFYKFPPPRGVVEYDPKKHTVFGPDDEFI